MQETKIFRQCPPSHAMSLSIGNGLFGEIFSPYGRNFRIFLQSTFNYARNYHKMRKIFVSFKWVQDTSKKFSSDAKNSCIMREAKISRHAPPPSIAYYIVISYSKSHGSIIVLDTFEKFSLRSKKFSSYAKDSCIMRKAKISPHAPLLALHIIL